MHLDSYISSGGISLNALMKSRLGMEHTDAELREIVGRFGRVAERYGGYEIVVVDDRRFPWREVFDTLLRYSFDIWIERKDEKMMVLSKSKEV